ncbi:MAG: hypothetical protein ACC657_05385 [Thiohalomonadales bacterium]
MNKLVALQKLPKNMLLNEIKTMNCKHNAEFCLYDKKCWNCVLGRECLELIGKYDSFDTHSSQKVYLKKIRIAQTYIYGKLEYWRHDYKTCNCDACNWLLNTTKILAVIDS